ncbi:MAG: acyl carrier protein [Gammaproteobacteria bacterium]
MKQKLITYIQTELLNQQHTITADQDLLISGLIDSIGVMRLVGFIEKDLDTTIPPKDVTLENFGNVNTIVSYIDSQLAAH